MRRILTLALAAVTLAACGDGPTRPAAQDAGDDLALAASLTAAGLAAPSDAALPSGMVVRPGGMPEVDALASVPRLPAALRLTSAQQQQVRELTEAFVAATRADRAALEAILRELRPRSGGTPPTAEQVAAILARTAPIQARLIAAQQGYRDGVLAVLTPEQRAWIEAERERERQRWQACQQNPLTDAQREQIAARSRAFEEATRADRQALVPIMREAEAARRAGRPEAEIRAILDRARPIRERLAAADRQLRTELLAVLTPAQRDNRCWIR